jgi:radical SAM protein with 4Fe4S-binding SPASM domain
VSLDDARAAKASALAGAPGYLDEAVRTIRNLLDAGVPLEVNAVITKINYEHLGELSSLLASLGVAKLTLSPFHDPYPYRAAASRLSNPQFDAAALLASAACDGIEVAMGSGASPGEGEYCGSQVCEIGASSLDVMPDGSVSRCHYLVGDTRMFVGSLADQSILEVWNHGRLAALSNPPRDGYEGSACVSCEGHDGCNSRGRCYLSALQQQGRMYAPDAFCMRQ